MPGLRTVVSPFDSGRRDVGMGLGVRRLAEDAQLLEAAGGAAPAWVGPVDEARPEVARVMEGVRELRDLVAGAVNAGELPLVLAGNCNSCLGTVAGVGAERIGVVWFDAHADFDTPDDNLSGFFDVMALTMLTGGAWRALRETVAGLRPVDEGDVVLGAVRDLEPYQRARLHASRVRTVPGEVDPAGLAGALDDLAGRVSRAYLHVDLDALDGARWPANAYAAPGGPSLERLVAAIDAVFDRFEVAAVALTAYDPAADPEGRVPPAARELVAAVARRARASMRG